MVSLATSSLNSVSPLATVRRTDDRLEQVRWTKLSFITYYMVNYKISSHKGINAFKNDTKNKIISFFIISAYHKHAD